MEKLLSDRLPYVSLLRVIAMLLIVIYHSLCFYTGRWWHLSSYSDVVRVWYILSIPVVNIGLTLFVFISGFLFGYHYYKMTGDVVSLQRILCHSYQRETLIYIGVIQENIDESLMKFNVLSGRKRGKQYDSRGQDSSV